MLTYYSSYQITPLPHLTPRWRPMSPRGYRPEIRPYLWVRGIALYIYLPLFPSSFLPSKMVRTPTCENAQPTPCFYLFFSLFYCFLFFIFFFNWRIIALQYCVGLCHPSAWISHRYAYVPSPVNPLPHLHTPSHTSRLSQEYWVELPVSHSTSPPAIYFIYDNVYVSKPFCQLVPPSPSPRVSTSLYS